MDKAKLINKIELIIEEELKRPDKNIIRYLGKPIDLVYKGTASRTQPVEKFDSFKGDCSKYKISTGNIEMMSKLYQKLNENEKNIFINEILKSFDYENSYYHQINYLAFSVLLKIKKETALKSLFKKFVISYHFNNTLQIFGVILSYKHDYFSDCDIKEIKTFILNIRDQINNVDPTLKIIPRTSGIFIQNWIKNHILLKEKLLPCIIDVIHQIEYYRLGKYVDDINPEINEDKLKLLSKLDEFKFPDDAKRCLIKVDDIYNGSPDHFDFKSCLGHLRTFFEEIFRELKRRYEKLEEFNYEAPSESFKYLKDYLVKVKFINLDESHFYQKFYDLISNEGVHALTSSREHVRICKNVIYEMALLLMERYSNVAQPNAN